ncbi:MAG TPA: biotin--[acetyl-CoA-carboxylase] ligase [Phycisphaerales bacterium]|nr:biotin--[acetyl-CoA-carboxylase] ligase [Phycisphaerales bacterium]
MVAEPHPDIPIQWFDAVDSTNRVAADALQAGQVAPQGQVFVARRQTVGQGRMGRQWQSPEGGLWCTVVLPAADSPTSLDALGLRVGVACVTAIRRVLADAGATPLVSETGLKWPNDVLINRRKACGSLCRTIRYTNTTWLILGVGINVNNDPHKLGEDLRRPATSLAREAGRRFDLPTVLTVLLTELAAAAREPGLTTTTLDRARSMLLGLGEPLTLSLPESRQLTGTLAGLNDRGHVVLDTPTGPITAENAIESIEHTVLSEPRA